MPHTPPRRLMNEYGELNDEGERVTDAWEKTIERFVKRHKLAECSYPDLCVVLKDALDIPLDIIMLEACEAREEARTKKKGTRK